MLYPPPPRTCRSSRSSTSAHLFLRRWCGAVAKCTCVRPMRRNSPLDWMACQLPRQTRVVGSEEERGLHVSAALREPCNAARGRGTAGAITTTNEARGGLGGRSVLLLCTRAQRLGLHPIRQWRTRGPGLHCWLPCRCVMKSPFAPADA